MPGNRKKRLISASFPLPHAQRLMLVASLVCFRLSYANALLISAQLLLVLLLFGRFSVKKCPKIHAERRNLGPMQGFGRASDRNDSTSSSKASQMWTARGVQCAAKRNTPISAQTPDVQAPVRRLTPTEGQNTRKTDLHHVWQAKSPCSRPPKARRHPKAALVCQAADYNSRLPIARCNFPGTRSPG